MKGSPPRKPTFGTLPACCASVASGATRRLMVSTTKSPICRMRHLGKDGWRESSRRRLTGGAGRIGRAPLFDDLVRLYQQRRRDRQAEHSYRLTIDDQQELGGLFDRQVRRLRALNDPIHVICSASVQIREIHAVA